MGRGITRWPAPHRHRCQPLLAHTSRRPLGRLLRLLADASGAQAMRHWEAATYRLPLWSLLPGNWHADC